jgi:hypothetical protein
MEKSPLMKCGRQMKDSGKYDYTVVIYTVVAKGSRG